MCPNVYSKEKACVPHHMEGKLNLEAGSKLLIIPRDLLSANSE